MPYKIDKPKQTAQQLINKMKVEKGIKFKYISEHDAEMNNLRHNEPPVR